MNPGGSNLDHLRCYDPSTPYVPQNRFLTPAGFDDLPFLVPFSFLLPADGSISYKLPVSLDDDYEFYWRGMIFPNAGLNLSPGSIPALIRLWDTNGNPLSDALVLALGVWCQSGFGINGYGFPFDDEIRCSPGGVVSFDIQLPTLSEGVASGHFTIGTETITFTGLLPGVAFVIAEPDIPFLQPPNTPLSASVSGNEVFLTFGSDGAGFAVTPTMQQVANIFNGDAGISALMTTSLSGPDPTQLYEWPFGEANFNVPVPPNEPSLLSGYLEGVKRVPACVVGARATQ
jgi:hypothetical protein